jgi:hypothetical protein
LAIPDGKQALSTDRGAEKAVVVGWLALSPASALGFFILHSPA